MKLPDINFLRLTSFLDFRFKDYIKSEKNYNNNEIIYKRLIEKMKKK